AVGVDMALLMQSAEELAQRFKGGAKGSYSLWLLERQAPHIMKICHYPNYQARYHFGVQLTFEHLIHRHFWRINFHIYLPSFEDSMAVRGKRYNGPLKKNTKPRLLFGSRYYSK